MLQNESRNAIGQKDNYAELIPISKLRHQFSNPPPEYGPIDCWWWEAGHLDKERMRWQLEEMKEKGVAGTWYYPRFVYGQPLSSDPHYWTEEWWDFTKFSIEEHRRLGMQVWFNDWTAHQFFPNRVREEREKNPALTGRRLVIYEAESKAPGIIKIDIPPDDEILYAAAYKKVDGGLDYTSRIDLSDAVVPNVAERPNVAEVARLREFGKLTWEAKEAGWLVTVVTSQPHDLDYLNRVVADRWIEIFLGVYEERLPDFVGNTLKAYGTDELDVLNGNILYSASFISRFKAEKGYDPSPYLIGLFHDIGEFTDKIRCDYYDVMVSMLEENLYQPFSEWLNKRGMLFTEFCPRGKNEDMLVQTYQYGDFFRYMRNYNIPGAEDQRMSTPRTFFAKTASSIAHLYGHNRVGVCAYWGAGWGHNTQQNLAWTNENYVYGVNLYNRHGVLYSTLGGWYEWVPPAVHFRQPYWKYWKHFSDYVKRLSYIMSQGVHVADVALLYPLTTLHANWSGRRDFNDIAQDTGTTTYDLAHLIYKSGIDLDFIDSQSLCRAEVSDGKLKVAGLEFRAVVLPPMTTIRTETLKKIKQFYDSGGTVVAFRRLPNASPENGRDDPNIQAMLQEIFGVASGSRTLASSATTKAFFLPDDESPIPEIISNAIVQDVVASEKDIFHTHQKIGKVDVYFLFNAQKEKRSISFVFRAAGEPEIWNAFTGETKPVHRFEAQGSRTKVRLDMEPYEGILLVFQKGKSRLEVLEDNLTTLTSVEPRNDGILIQGYCDVGGKKRIRVVHEGKEYISEVQVDEPPEPICLDGLWDFRLEPTMDNRWGDFRYPPSEAFIGAETRRFRYMEEGEKSDAERSRSVDPQWRQTSEHEREFDDSNWQNVTYSYGPYWWTIGPFEDEKGPEEILQKAKAGEIETDKRYEVAGKSLQWERYSFSQKFGSEAADVHNEWGGLLGVSENFLVFDATGDDKNVTRYLFTNVYSPEEKDYHLNFGGKAKFQRKAWINGEQVISVSEAEAEAQEKVNLKRGWNSVLLEMVHPEGEKIWTFAVFQETSATPSFDPYTPLLRCFIEPQKLIFDITPEKESRVGWYRFSAPPGLRAMKLSLNAKEITAWIDDQPVPVEEGKITLESPMEGVSQVALRVEQESGCYAGAAFPLPVAFECEEGKISLGDWCDYGLEIYSGGAVYTKVVKLEKSHLEGKVLLDLGQVSTTAEVHVNGKLSGVKMAQSFQFDITPLVKEGENQIQVKVVNTLANHMSTYPTNYVYEGQTVSGLLGPVRLQFLSKVTLIAEDI